MKFPDFSVRSTIPEKMDQVDVSPKEIQQALKELEIINKYLGGYNVILNALNNLSWEKESMTIMDLGSGGGDMLREIAKWADSKNKKVNLIGVDRNEIMTKYASDHSMAFSNIRYITCDVFDDLLITEKPDIVINSLFCHHFDNNDLIQLLNRMKQLAARAVIVNDLHRQWIAYYLIKIITGFFSKTYLVKYDAPLSVARALTGKEWRDIISEAKIKQFQLKWMWAWRWQLLIYTDKNEWS